jgi:hypothetical protein
MSCTITCFTTQEKFIITINNEHRSAHITATGNGYWSWKDDLYDCSADEDIIRLDSKYFTIDILTTPNPALDGILHVGHGKVIQKTKWMKTHDSFLVSSIVHFGDTNKFIGF